MWEWPLSPVKKEINFLKKLSGNFSSITDTLPELLKFLIIPGYTLTSKHFLFNV